MSLSRKLPWLLAGSRWPVLIFLVNVSLSLIYCFYLYPRFLGEDLRLDPDGYGDTGRVLFESGEFDGIDKAPLYPAFVALISVISMGYKVSAVQSAQCLLLAFTCFLVYFVLISVLDVKSSRWAGAVCAVFPLFIWYTPRLWTEIFLMLVIACYTAVLIKFLRQPSDELAVFCGLVTGIAVLTKGISLVFFVITPIIIFWKHRQRALRWVILCLFTMTMTLMPWTWRNWKLTGRFFPVHIHAGYNCLLGNGFARNWQIAPLSYAKLKEITLQDYPMLAEENDLSLHDLAIRDERFLSVAYSELIASPDLLLKKLMVNSITYWYLAADRTKSILTGIMQLPFVILAISGAVCAFRRHSDALILLVPIMGVMGGSVVVFSFARLSMPVMPYVIGLAIYGINIWWKERRAGVRWNP